MALMACVALLSLSTILSTCSFPFDYSTNEGTLAPETEIVCVTEVMTSDVVVLETVTVEISSSTVSQTLPSRIISTPPPALTTITETDSATVTETITALPAIITIVEPPSTVTEIITTSSIPSPVITPTAWAAPTHILDLSAFNVTSFAYGQPNMQIVQGVPPDGSSSSFAVAEVNTLANTSSPSAASDVLNDTTSALQLFYPADSTNPGNEPQGGADFYATPLDLTHAQNVTLEYSVFFPADFDWVLAGKLPGVYGGHTGCSGGDNAITCFSTRLMWREGGAGELYLYAPKDKQSAALCSAPPLSVCDADYGLSIGRGSFNFTAGAWTHLRQTITLNTPGEQDGGFVLQVNGQEAINRSDVFYRDVPPEETPESPALEMPALVSTSALSAGLLGPLIGSVFSRVTHFMASRGFLLERDSIDGSGQSSTEQEQRPPMNATGGTSPLAQTIASSDSHMIATYSASSEAPMTTSTTTIYGTASGPGVQAEDLSHPPTPVGFTGLFFSTFFGGHEPRYATPRDQYAWFKDFAMTING